MLRGLPVVMVLLLLAAACGGCSQPTRTEKTFQVEVLGPLDQAKQLLRQYADGAPPGSEVTTYPQLIEGAKKADLQKGEILEKGLEDIQKSPAGRAAKAKALLGQL